MEEPRKPHIIKERVEARPLPRRELEARIVIATKKVEEVIQMAREMSDDFDLIEITVRSPDYATKEIARRILEGS